MFFSEALPSLTNQLGVLPETFPGVYRFVSVCMIRDFFSLVQVLRNLYWFSIAVGINYRKQRVKATQIHYLVVFEIKSLKWFDRAVFHL